MDSGSVNLGSNPSRAILFAEGLEPATEGEELQGESKSKLILFVRGAIEVFSIGFSLPQSNNLIN